MNNLNLNIYIGKKEHNHCSAVKVDNYDISENSCEYWFNHDYFGFNFIQINKKSNVGKKITEMIKQKVSIEKMEKYLIKETIKKLSPEQILEMINEIKKESYNKGREDKASEIRNVFNFK